MPMTVHVDIVSAEVSIFSGLAELVIVPGEAGELGIYPRHAALLTRIKPSSVSLNLPDQAAEE
jgi:F-type H+-transporting ATPase subunit epsilon